MWLIQKETGWSDHYLLWEVNLPTLRMKLADAARYSSKENAKVIDDFDEFEFKT